MDGGMMDRPEFKVLRRGQSIDCDLSHFYKLRFVGIRTEAHDNNYFYELKLAVTNKIPQQVVIM